MPLSDLASAVFSQIWNVLKKFNLAWQRTDCMASVTKNLPVGFSAFDVNGKTASCKIDGD
jgi:hypothetical protein